MRKTAIALSAMLLTGVALLAALGALVELRVGVPVEPHAAAALPVNDDSLAATQRLGLEEALGAALRHFEGEERAKATHALDAAHRAAMMAKGSLGLPVIEKEVARARRALWLGNPDRATELLRRVLDRLKNADGRAAPIAHTPPPLAMANAYSNALLVNGHGVRIGEVKQVRGRTGTRLQEAVLVLGGWRDVLGFIDVGGTEVVVPVDSLIFGKPKDIGTTQVLLPTRADQPDAVLRELGARDLAG